MKKVETLYYKTGEDNEEYWALLDDLRRNAKHLGVVWESAYAEITYEKDGYIYVVTEDMDYGVQYSIEKFKKEEA